MIVVHTRLPIKEEFQEQFLKHLQKRSHDELSAMEGFEGISILKPLTVPHMLPNNTFVIETKWKDLESFLGYTRSEAFKKSHENLPPQEWFAGAASVEVFEA
ncbi:antibiotic biosynthesis monooxygenase [Nitratiruptor sp. YY09-18]|uniref:antibiotic biosynthesis monooxygenase family protein n=1 Tax=Nitratiruptor sp. YY09-18 TaxID=2724901 RepID=UPI001916AA30|nr:antibiotic biosynthesis monooxygenase family protein [Nitratiruptor sp. YY09-18]BCD67181.1 heme oxygenase (mycobilin-producing) [Nitratiruptor sp. YY09-18]